MAAINNYCKGNDFSLYYSIMGQGESIVFIHGNFNDSRIWDYQVGKFSDKYKVVFYDLRGYGKSSIPKSTFSHIIGIQTLLSN